MAIGNKGWDSVEILQVIESFSRENGMSKEAVFCALEDTIGSIAKKQYGNSDIIVKVDRNNGDLKMFNELVVISDEEMERVLNSKGGDTNDTMEENDQHTIGNCVAFSEASRSDPDIRIGEVVRELLPSIELNTVIVQSAKSILSSKISEIQKKMEQENCQQRVGEIFSGLVTHINSSGLFLQTNHGNAFISKKNLLPSDHPIIGERIKACLIAIDPENKGPQLIMSRTDDSFLIQLMHQEIPEIYNKIIKIMGVTREPGSRSKVSVFSSESSIDAVGSCIGIKGARIKAIMGEIGNEKIDVINWSDNTAQYVINCLQPIQVKKIVISEEDHMIEVIVDEANLSSAIGKRGQNIRMISKLVGWNIVITDEENYSQRNLQEFNRSTAMLMSRLDIEEIFAQLLVAEGYTSIDKLAHTDKSLLSQIEGLDEEIAEELIDRAQESLNAHGLDDSENKLQRYKNSISQNKKTGAHEVKITPSIMRSLSFSGIKTIYNLAELSAEELVEIMDKANTEISFPVAEKIIKNARDKVYFSFASDKGKEQ